MTGAVRYVLGVVAGGGTPWGKSGCGGGLAVGAVVVPCMPTESEVVVSGVVVSSVAVGRVVVCVTGAGVAVGGVVVCVTGLTGLLIVAVNLSTSVCVLSIRAVRRR